MPKDVVEGVHQKMSRRNVRIWLKYCGGCNPDIERGDLVKRLEKLMTREGFFVDFSATMNEADIRLLVNGCPSACLEDEYLNALESSPCISIQGARIDCKEVFEKDLPKVVWEKIKANIGD
jgi:hypothetical protein